ncbi:uncharacterized protein YjdB [Aequitasia blattaphilus]|uniref:Ig-like domain-containing protein n=1 Tax=Aequitasia blattaphilus TaxID=2949332 RepID=A0ABT1E4V0_9FIRM|nr:Ig-like domain-containing protein [Aequitasia blattaphilus]MCP1100860.1 Ig-like domain-containing protein [Aequitasia blattaphilus]MCR8613500.1 Ig-like domain-containing protein [Aequitasia blattaphilus]
MKQKQKIKKSTALLLAGVLAISTAIAAIGATLAAKPINWTATAPEGMPTNERYHVDAAGIKDNKKKQLSFGASSSHTWGSSNIGIARVKESTGSKATYLAAKPGIFIAYRSTEEGQLGSTTAMVYDSTKPYTYSISKNHSVIQSVGKTDQIPITMKDMNGAKLVDAVTWSSDDTDIATVTETTGEITAVGEGLANIRGSFVDCYGQSREIHYLVSVNKPVADLFARRIILKLSNGMEIESGDKENVAAATDINLEDRNPASMLVEVGKSQEAPEVTVMPESAENKKVAWESSKSNIAEVDSATGEVTGVESGVAVITATVENKDGSRITASYPVYVHRPVTKITLGNPESSTIIPGGLQRGPTVSITPENATNRQIVWSSSDSESVKVLKDWGDIEGCGAGTGSARITATITNLDGSKVEASYEMSCPVLATGMTLGDQEKKVLSAGEKMNAPSIKISPESAGNQQVVWSSSESRAAIVDEATGEVTALEVTDKSIDRAVKITATLTNAGGSPIIESYWIYVR